MFLKISYNRILIFLVCLALGLWSAISLCSVVEKMEDNFLHYFGQTLINNPKKFDKEDKQKKKLQIIKKDSIKSEGGGISGGIGTGEGSGICDAKGSGSKSVSGNENLKTAPDFPVNDSRNRGLQILSNPKPEYTKEARKNNIQGKVMLQVTFLASGRIGGVSVIEGLPYGLNEKAIEAAKQIKFQPAQKGEQKYTVTKRIQYNFTIY